MAVVTTSGLPPGVGANPPLGDPARLDVLDAGQDVGHRAAHVPEHPQARVGRPQAGRSSPPLGGEAPVLVLMGGREGGRLRQLGRRLCPRRRCRPRRAHRGQDEGDPRAGSHGWSSPGGPILLNRPDKPPVCQANDSEGRAWSWVGPEFVAVENGRRLRKPFELAVVSCGRRMGVVYSTESRPPIITWCDQRRGAVSLESGERPNRERPTIARWATFKRPTCRG